MSNPPPIAGQGGSPSGLEFNNSSSSNNPSSAKAVSDDVLPDFLEEPLYEVNSVRFKVNKQGASIGN